MPSSVPSIPGLVIPGPWNHEQRPGDNKWTAGIFARDPASGSARWFYQYSPHDEHDYDGVNEQILLDMPFAGKMQKVLIHIRTGTAISMSSSALRERFFLQTRMGR